ncbi:hypothetical protein B566_EDAN009630 [Ephemera danica]|nr:hypothetical protein B566_EDAN009630 [Ephemera danica]
MKNRSIREVATLRGSSRLQHVMTEIERYSQMPRQGHFKPSGSAGEFDPEYQLIVEANNLAADVDAEIGVIHAFVREKYSKRFPELESLVVAPLDYVRTVRELGNELEKAKNNEILMQTLTQATIMVVSVTASTTQGQILTVEELAEIEEACDMALEVHTFKQKILDYVEGRMTYIAPNLSAIVGASTAAKLMGVAGGLSRLANMPACNVLVLGAQKKTLSGFSQVATLPHTGFVYYSEIVQETPPDMRRKAARLFVKPLPKPIDPSRKKRGGKRVRKMKERYAMTELRKQANRLNFGEIEDDAYQEDLGYTRGTIGKTGTGRIRLPQVDEKTKVRISKTLQRNMQKQQQWGGATSVKRQVSGTASSVAFTPMQGLEIVNPQAAEKKVNEANAKYFSNTSGFIKVQKN